MPRDRLPRAKSRHRRSGKLSRPSRQRPHWRRRVWSRRPSQPLRQSPLKSRLRRRSRQSSMRNCWKSRRPRPEFLSLRRSIGAPGPPDQEANSHRLRRPRRRPHLRHSGLRRLYRGASFRRASDCESKSRRRQAHLPCPRCRPDPQRRACVPKKLNGSRRGLPPQRPQLATWQDLVDRAVPRLGLHLHDRRFRRRTGRRRRAARDRCRHLPCGLSSRRKGCVRPVASASSVLALRASLLRRCGRLAFGVPKSTSVATFAQWPRRQLPHHPSLGQSPLSRE